MSSHLEARRRPPAMRVMRQLRGDCVPPVVEAVVRLFESQVLEQFGEAEAARVLERLRDQIVVLHVPDRRVFEGLFLRRRVHPVEVRVDWRTERVYLLGVGVPGREELENVRIPVVNRYGETQLYLLETIGVEADDTVVAYTEASWRELAEAEERVERMPAWQRAALLTFFQVPETHLVATVLTLVSLTDEDLLRIAGFVMDNNPHLWG